MAKVYVTQETPHDFTKAEQFGQIEFLTNEDLHNIKNSLHNDALVREIRMRLHKFNSYEDYVVVAGSPYVAAIVFMVIAQRGHQEINFLRWSNRDGIYIPVTVRVSTAVQAVPTT